MKSYYKYLCQLLSYTVAFWAFAKKCKKDHIFFFLFRIQCSFIGAQIFTFARSSSKAKSGPGPMFAFSGVQ